LAHAFGVWKISYKGLKKTQLLGQLGVMLTFGFSSAMAAWKWKPPTFSKYLRAVDVTAQT
jgi:hypothetical protein